MKSLFCLILLMVSISSIRAQTQSLTFNGKNAKTEEVICEGEEIILKVIGFSKNAKFEWEAPAKYSYITKRQKIFKKNIGIKIDSTKPEYSGKYILTIKENGSKTIKEVTVKIKAQPKLPILDYIINDSKLSIIEKNNFDTAKNTLDWTLPNGNILKTKAIEIVSPKLSDLGKYKLKVTSDGCSNSSTIEVVLEKKEKEEEKKKEKTDTTQHNLFFYGNIGGNIDFINRKLGINSVYSDIQFKPELIVSKNLKLKFPIRVYYNNGAGPQQVDESKTFQQNFITIDTISLSKEKKVRYWEDKPSISYKTENRNVGLNIPITLSKKIANNENWSFLLGVNLDFVWVTNRIFDYSYITKDSTIHIVDKGNLINTGSAYVFYDTSNKRPRLPVGRDFKYSQIYSGIQTGVEYIGKSYDFSLKYSLGVTNTYLERGTPYMGGANHIIQLMFLEKTTGIQFFGDVKIANIQKSEDSQLKTVASAPYFYFSIAKTINLAKIKEVFFP